MPVTCALCHQPIDPPESAMKITEERIMDGQAVTEATSSGLYHPGE